MANTPYLVATGKQSSGGSGIITCGVTTTTTTDDSIVVCVATTGTANDANTITDTQGNSYNEIEGPTGSGSVSGSVWQADGTSQLVNGVDSIIVNTGDTAPTVVIVVGDDGVGVSVQAEDASVSATGSSTAPNSGTTGTLNSSFEHAIAFVVDLAAGGTPTWPSPWSSHVLSNVEDAGSAIRCSAAYQDVTSSTALNASATISSTSWSCLLVTNQVSPLFISSPTPLPSGIVGLPYTCTFTSYGGVGSITWSVISGSLPPGTGLASGVVSGTPTAAGTYNFTIQAGASTYGPTTSMAVTITIAASAVTGALEPTLYGNLLTAADSQFQGGSGFTWAPFQNASAVNSTTRAALTGSQCGYWTASTSGTTAIKTGQYPVKPNMPYVVSGFMLPQGGVRNCYIGVQWMSQVGNVLYVDGGPAVATPTPTVSPGSYWVPMVELLTSPPNATAANIIVWCDSNGQNTVAAGEITLIDNIYFTQTNAQVMIDFLNPSYGNNPNTVISQTAGAAFMDVTPWLRKDVGFVINRGRQDAISEMQPSSSQFTLQNDQGVFTRFNSESLISFLGITGAYPNLNQRYQINVADQIGNWFTRLDGPVSEIDYSFDNTGNTSVALFTGTDVLAYVNRQPQLLCWTYQTILADNPLYFWPLNDYDQVENIVSFDSDAIQQTVTVATSGYSSASEVAGFNGPPLRIRVFTITEAGFTGPVIAWADTTFGVETLADSAGPNVPDGGIDDPGTGIEPTGGYWTAGSNQPNSQTRGLVSGFVGPFSTPLPNISLQPVFNAGNATNLWSTNPGWELFAQFEGTQTIASSQNSYTFELFFMVAPEITDVVKDVLTGSPALPVAPFVQTAQGYNVGPFICWGLGNSRNLQNLAAGIFIDGNSTTFQINEYGNPPAFSFQNFPGNTAQTATSGVSIPFVPIDAQSTSYTGATLDGAGCPHHLVITMQSYSTGAVLTGYLDGIQIPGTITIPVDQAYDLLFIGGPHGGCGNWYGNVSCAAVYPYILTGGQIQEHCQRGQYGNWEQTSDQCIVELSEYLKIPAFWFNIPGNGNIGTGNGLSMCDYLDISGQSALASMQLFEQAEHGTLYVNSMGQLSFRTRDWRMGYGTPDLLLPPDTFDATNIGYELIDQFQTNEMSISSIAFPSGATYINQNSILNYGIYTQNPVGSPLQLPLFTFNRAFVTLGLPSYSYNSDPNLIDLASWLSISYGDPFLTPTSITVDLLTLDLSTGLTQTDLLNLDIGNSISPSGTLPVSFPNTSLSTQWFIEGITETYNLVAHTIQFYTSPAEPQQAWIIGDPVYGVLGSTARVGISTADTNPPEADGKDVSHDSGGPYWPPTFTGDPYYAAILALSNLQAYYPLTGMQALDYSGHGRNLTESNNNCALFRYAGLSGATNGTNTVVEFFANASGFLQGSYAPSSSSSWSFGVWVNLGNEVQASSGSNSNPRLFSSSHTAVDNGGFEIYLANGNIPTFVVGNGSTHATVAASSAISSNGWNFLVVTLGGGTVTGYVNGVSVGTASLSGNIGSSTAHLTVGGGTYNGDYLNGFIGQCMVTSSTLSSSTVSSLYGTSATSFSMNNNDGSGHFFVGANDMRGLSWGLNKMLNPPMLVVGQQTTTQGIQWGSIANPSLNWDNIYVDTEGGIGLQPDWPGWYVVTVPGFYEIDACVNPYSNTNNAAFQSWICVAQQGAQHIQATNAGFLTDVTPITNLQYVAPVGEAVRINGGSEVQGNYSVPNPTTRMYLGAGDMVAVCCTNNSLATINTDTFVGGSFFSMRWCGLSNTGDDRSNITANILGGGIIQPQEFASTLSTTFGNTATYSYFGGGSSVRPTSIENIVTNKEAWQGGGGSNGKSGNGTQYSQAVFDFAQINATIGSFPIVGGSITATCNKTATNQPGSTVTMVLGMMFGNPGQSPWVLQPFSGGSQNCLSGQAYIVFTLGQTQTVELPASFFNLMLNSYKINGHTAGAVLFGNNQLWYPSNNGAFEGGVNDILITIRYQVS